MLFKATPGTSITAAEQNGEICPVDYQFSGYFWIIHWFDCLVSMVQFDRISLSLLVSLLIVNRGFGGV
jgi:hypothetical protein